MNSKYKKFLAVGLVSLAVGIGFTMPQDAQAMSIVQTSSIGVNAAIAGANAKQATESVAKQADGKDINYGLLIAIGAPMLLVAGMGAYALKEETNIVDNIKDRINKIRDKSLDSENKSENKFTI